MKITTVNPMCSCGHRQSQHMVSGSQSCLAYDSNAPEVNGLKVTCLCSAFSIDIPTPGKFQPANHVGHDDTCRNCGKSRIFHLRDECSNPAVPTRSIHEVLDALRNSQTLVNPSEGHRAVKALAVLILTPHIQNYLHDNDPQALRQAVEAILGVKA